MPDPGLHCIVRTPFEVVLEQQVRALRVPTETGHVGLRPHAEATVLAVEPGLVLIRTGSGLQFVGTAGGLLHWDGVHATLLTPVAVVGDDAETVLTAIERAMAVPSAEHEARAILEKLEGSLLSELRRPGGVP
jgi:F0F1-type ATP synthase epsilon subunit